MSSSSSKARATIKSTVRKVSRAAGYEIVPIGAGFRRTQQRLLQECDLVVDVGANVGQFAEKVRDLGYRGDVVSFEPGREAFRVLEWKASRHRENWSVRKVALGATDSTAMLRVAANSVSSSLLDVGAAHIEACPESAEVAREEVPVRTLDGELRASLSQRIYLKLDVQGFELPVLLGSTRTLRRASAVQLEVSFDDLYAGQSDWLELCAFMYDNGFVARYLEPGYENSDTGAMLQADFVFCPRVTPDQRHSRANSLVTHAGAS